MNEGTPEEEEEEDTTRWCDLSKQEERKTSPMRCGTDAKGL